MREEEAAAAVAAVAAVVAAMAAVQTAGGVGVAEAWCEAMSQS